MIVSDRRTFEQIPDNDDDLRVVHIDILRLQQSDDSGTQSSAYTANNVILIKPNDRYAFQRDYLHLPDDRLPHHALAALRPYLKNQDNPGELARLLSDSLDVALALLAVKQRYANRAEVTSFEISVDSRADSHPIRVTIDTEYEDEAYLAEEEAFWEWWLKHHGPVSSQVGVALW